MAITICTRVTTFFDFQVPVSLAARLNSIETTDEFLQLLQGVPQTERAETFYASASKLLRFCYIRIINSIMKKIDCNVKKKDKPNLFVAKLYICLFY